MVSKDKKFGKNHRFSSSLEIEYGVFKTCKFRKIWNLEKIPRPHKDQAYFREESFELLDILFDQRSNIIMAIGGIGVKFSQKIVMVEQRRAIEWIESIQFSEIKGHSIV